ncbi:acyl-CoA thioesterase [Alicyclobacillus vulcanalis]|uniref:Acyl-CoA thioester hydrolase n=1 Tax=Alicyclobacillus vulcanalis TaxID=252246 RepID=A0A1N7PSZ6_9BACL|nr:acyl-CoA thioesterase [Alicyclobacillus vulcanalis]SIT13731.1 acyl-CoA thioester hydrolase [Alicyclobacillus vulcanalis]
MPERVVTPLEVRWGECDPAGIVYHPSYIDWFSIARMHFLKENGIQYMSDFHDRGVTVVVTDVACHYRRALRAEDLAHVCAALVEMSRTRLAFRYDVTDAAGELCARGETRHAFVDRNTLRPVNLEKFAPALWARLKQLPIVGDGENR